MAKKLKRLPQLKNKTPLSKADADYDAWHVRIVALFCILGFLIYANALNASFHFDDYAAIINNPAVRNLGDWQGLFNAFNTRFVVGWTFAVNYFFGQLNVTGYHFFNVWLHVCTSVLIYTFVLQILKRDNGAIYRTLGQRVRIAFSAAIIFLVHPLATQPVNYIWQRSTLLVAFFFISTLVLYIHNRVNRLMWYEPVSWLTCLLAMFSKENAVILPVMLLILEGMFLGFKPWRDGKTWLRLTPFLLLMFIVPLFLQRTEMLTLDLMRPFDWSHGVNENIISRHDYVLTQINVLRTYLRLMVLPYGQNIDHDYPLAGDSGWGIWAASLLLIATLAASVWYFAKKNKLWSLGILWFFVTSAIECFVTSQDLCVEHRMYLPMAGILIAFFTMLYDGFDTKYAQKIIYLVLAVSVVFGFLTINRNLVWRDDLTLWSDAVKKSPQKARPLNNRGQILRKVGHVQLALNDFNRAIALDARFLPAYINRASLFKSGGQLDLALIDYSTAISLKPMDAEAYASRGSIYKRKGEFDKALNDYIRAIEIQPSNPEYYSSRAFIYQNQKNYQKAMDDYTMAIKVQPDYVYALNNRGNLYLKSGEFPQALADYNRCILVDEMFGEAYMNRAIVEFKMGQFQQSHEDVEKARRLGMVPHSDFIRELKSALENKNILNRP